MCSKNTTIVGGVGGEKFAFYIFSRWGDEKIDFDLFGGGGGVAFMKVWGVCVRS